MKKTFKRLGAVLLAAFMLLSTTICALAVEGADASTTGKTITLNVSNVGNDDTVSAYKLVWYNDDGNGYKFDNDFESYINTKKAEDQTAEQYLASLDAAGVNKLLEGYATECNKNKETPNLPTASASAKAANGNVSLTLDAGYYLLLTTTTSQNSKVYTPLSAFVKVDGKNLVVYAGSNKNALTAEQDGPYKVSAKFEDGPTIDKKTNATKSSEDAAWKDTAAAGVGDIVRFYVAVTIPKYNNVSALNLTVNDTLTNLKYKDGSVKVYQSKPDPKGVNDSNLVIENAIKNAGAVAGEYKVDNGTGTQSLKFELDYAKIMEGAAQSKTVYVYYEAIMQKESVVNEKHGGENVATLTYSNAAKPDSEYTTDKKQTNVYNYYLNVNKVKNDTETPLEGAKFSVYKEQTGGDAIQFVKENDTEYYRPAAEGETNTVTVLEANFRIRGLDANTYYLEEVETPKGYAKPEGRFEIKLMSKFDEQTNAHTGKLDAAKSSIKAVSTADDKLFVGGVNAEKLHQFDATIKNFSTPNLPTTGGTGTVLLSIGGVVLMAAGAYLLFFRKKKEN